MTPRIIFLSLCKTIVSLHKTMSYPDWLAMKAIMLANLSEDLEDFDIVYWNRWICEELRKEVEVA